MFKDLREYLYFLEKNKMLLKVHEKVDPRFEITAGIRKIFDSDGPTLLFENIKGFPAWRMVGGLYATQKLTALVLGLSMDATEMDIIQRYLECAEQRVKPKVVNTGPVKETILKGDEVDLTNLPMPT